MVNLENLDESLAEIRQAAKEYYARKSGTWKPKRDLDTELREDEARFRREAFMSVPWMVEPRMMRYYSGPPKIITSSVVPDLEKIERIRSAFEHLDTSVLEKRIKDALYKKMDLVPREDPPDHIIIDELPRSSPIPPLSKALKEFQHKFLHGEWESWPEPTVKIGAGKNPMAEHTIRAVKKSHAKRRFSKKSRHGIL